MDVDSAVTSISVVFGSTLLNIVLTILLLRLRFEHHERLLSLYSQCIILCRLKLLIEAFGLEFGTIDTISHFGPYGPSNENEKERAILWENLDGSTAQVAVDKSWAAQRRLPPTQEFSWDKDEAVYSLRGFDAVYNTIAFNTRHINTTYPISLAK